MYDCTSEDSFNNVRNWVRQVEAHTNGRENIECVLIGNKADLTDKKMVDAEQGAALAKEFGMAFFEASARSGLNVQEAFIHITKSIKNKLAAKEVEVNNFNSIPLEPPTKLRDTITKVPGDKKKRGCC